MKRSGADLEDVASWNNLASAFRRAAKGKRRRADVAAFESGLERELAGLRAEILSGTFQPGPMKAFMIRDPKPRLIHAPYFRDRVLHHALMAVMGPVLDRCLIADTFACREGKGSLAAVRRAQRHLRRNNWFCQIDIKGYFPAIDHARLEVMLASRFKNRALLRLASRIIRFHQAEPGKGLPIGALTSQVFANVYLSSADRFLTETIRVGGFVRYMDDLIWSGDSREAVEVSLSRILTVLEGDLLLTVKTPYRFGRSPEGLYFCGYRIYPRELRLSKRLKQRYRDMRRRLEQVAALDLIDDLDLQKGYASVLATTLHADARNWRAAELCQRPLEPCLAARYG